MFRWEYTRGKGKPRHSEPSLACLSVPRLVLKNVFQFREVWHVPSILSMIKGIPRACLTLMYQQLMARIMAAPESCGLVLCAIYTSQGEAAAPRLGLPLPQVFSQFFSFPLFEDGRNQILDKFYIKFIENFD